MRRYGSKSREDTDMQSRKLWQREQVLAQAHAVEAAARQAVRDALLFHKRMGNPICIWRDGRVVWIPPEEICLPEEGHPEERRS